MTFAVYLLCLYPDVFKRLRAEVLEKIGPTQMPSFDDIRTMKYLRAVINGESHHLCYSSPPHGRLHLARNATIVPHRVRLPVLTIRETRTDEPYLGSDLSTFGECLGSRFLYHHSPLIALLPMTRPCRIRTPPSHRSLFLPMWGELCQTPQLDPVLI